MDVLRRGAHSVDAIEVGDNASCPPLDGYDAAIVAGSVRMGKFQRRLVEVVRAQRDVLHRKRTAFLAVSLSAARKSEPAKREVKETAARFIRETRFRPDAILPVAGALFYTKYGFFLRLVMRLISRLARRHVASGRTENPMRLRRTPHAAPSTLPAPPPSLGRFAPSERAIGH